jgi:hypothetical protein
MPGPGTKKLTQMQSRFVAEYLKDGNATRAANAAGYSVKNKSDMGYRLLKRCAQVKEAIEQARKEVQVKAKYNLEAAMNECDDAIEFAKSSPTGANAYVKAVELKAKLNGLLEDKGSVGPSFNIVINGVDQPKIVRALPDSPAPILIKGIEDGSRTKDD